MYQTPLVQSRVLRPAGSETTRDTVGEHRLPYPFSNWNLGGEFDSRKVWFEPGHEDTLVRQSLVGNVQASYTGTLFADAEVAQLAQHLDNPRTGPNMPIRFRSLTGASQNELKTHGATAINRTIPTAPNVSVAQTIGELKQGLPDLALRALRRGDVAGEFLNQNFAVLPTIADFQAYRDTSKKAEEILAQWRRDSGRRIRRRYAFDEETSTEVVVKAGYLAGARITMRGNLVGTQKCTITTTTTRKWWFSGAYRYIIPKAQYGFAAKLQDYNRLWGIMPTASTAWELSPFSWLLDWETNIGDVISNASLLGQDGLALTYGYIMCHSNVRTEYLWQGEVYRGTVKFPLEVRSVVHQDIKQREPARPYGLGWTIESLSAKQIAVLAALGLSHKR